jgi:hypothetical protein
MIDDIRGLFDCDAIYLHSDWGQSKGARIEYQIAKELNLKVMFAGEFLKLNANIIISLIHICANN